MPPLITLTTDFGEGSSYVAQLKGVILSLAPTAQLVDLSHRIAPQDISEASLFLAETLPRFPEKSLHLAVVDPGVGTSRKILLAKWKQGFLVGPDNGLFSLLWDITPPATVYHFLDTPEKTISRTFHGRDLMAPVIARLAGGAPPEAFGREVTSWIPLRLPSPSISPAGIRGEVIHIDPFGNVITNIPASALPVARTNLIVRVHNLSIVGIQDAYLESATGELLALIDSQNRLEIAVASGNAARQFSLKRGDRVEVAF